MAILAQFLLRLAFGLAVGMAITPPEKVSSGFYRNHSYVTLGLTALASLVLFQMFTPLGWLAVAAAVFSYVCAVCWLYEAKLAGIAMLWFVFWSSYLAAFMALSIQQETILVGSPPVEETVVSLRILSTLNVFALLTSGLVLGVTTAAMLLGHWYLNSPGMELAPLRRLVAVAAAAVGVQMVLSGIGLAAVLSSSEPISTSWWMFVILRWSFGLIGVLALLWMAWQTLKIPNTQSATGILYVAVIGVFVGELAAALLSAESAYPL
jgi:hypothetical protein